jgi:hypothetical protein
MNGTQNRLWGCCAPASAVMKIARTSNLLLSFSIGLAVHLLVFAASADNLRTQNLVLHKGWNAVFLEVSPTNQDPDVLFAHTPVTIAATYLAADRPVQFIRDPGAVQWNNEGWGVWYAGNRPDAFLSSLHGIYGHLAYLIFAQTDFNWVVTGSVFFEPTRWKSDSFNLIGFPLDETAPPTFDQFFGGSSAQQPYRIFRLQGDNWTLVSDPIGTTMRSGEAFWVYCWGRSDFQGPLSARIPAGERLDFGYGTDAWVRVKNEGKDPMVVRVETVGTDMPLPLSYNVRGVTTASMDYFSLALPAVYQLPVLEPGDDYSLWLNLNREKMTANLQTRLLKISSDSGAQVWIPVVGSRPASAATH